MPSKQAYVKALVSGAILCIGGPALVMYVSPTEEEIFQRYNPELQKKALATRYQRQKEFDDFVCHLKEASKSPKPIWAALKDLEAKKSADDQEKRRAEHNSSIEEARRLQAEIRGSTK